MCIDITQVSSFITFIDINIFTRNVTSIRTKPFSSFTLETAFSICANFLKFSTNQIMTRWSTFAPPVFRVETELNYHHMGLYQPHILEYPRK